MLRVAKASCLLVLRTQFAIAGGAVAYTRCTGTAAENKDEAGSELLTRDLTHLLPGDPTRLGRSTFCKANT